MGFIHADGIAGDLGGGSLEIIDLSAEKLKEAVTLPLGGLRLIDSAGAKVEKAISHCRRRHSACALALAR